jgi:hypothetical protein
MFKSGIYAVRYILHRRVCVIFFVQVRPLHTAYAGLPIIHGELYVFIAHDGE